MTPRPSLRITRFSTVVLTALLALPLGGCGKKGASSGQAAAPTKTSSTKAVSGAPVVEPLLTVWRQGDPAAAVRQFLATDWSARPLFEPGSAMSLSEEQFKALAAGDRETKSAEVVAVAGDLKKLAQAVAQAGRDAAAGNDLPQARKHFTALKQYGDALDSADSLLIVRLVGQALKKTADAEMAKLGQ